MRMTPAIFRRQDRDGIGANCGKPVLNFSFGQKSSRIQ